MVNDFDKLLAVVKSVRTKEQARSAFKYYKLWERQYNQFQLERNPGLLYAQGYAQGMLLGFLIGNGTK